MNRWGGNSGGKKGGKHSRKVFACFDEKENKGKRKVSAINNPSQSPSEDLAIPGGKPFTAKKRKERGGRGDNRFRRESTKSLSVVTIKEKRAPLGR